MDGAHDLGGMQGFGPVRTADGELEFHESWELRAQVVGLLSGMARRPAIEALDPGEYLTSSYYVRWLRAAEQEAVRSGRLESADLDRWRQVFAEDPDVPPPVASDPEMVDVIRHLGPHAHGDVEAAKFAVGERVRVRRMRPEGHHRCPRTCAVSLVKSSGCVAQTRFPVCVTRRSRCTPCASRRMISSVRARRSRRTCC